MIARLLRFARKDLLWHWPALLALGLTLPLMYFLLLFSVSFNPQTVTHLEAHRLFVDGILTLAAMALANRLVVAEYYGRTQLFLEALPIRRVEPLAVKYLLGLSALGLAAAPSLCITSLVALRTEPVGPRFFALLGLRTALFLTCAWSGFFAMGLLGRLRVPLYSLLFGAFGVLSTTTDFEVSRFGPFALVGQQMVLDRTVVPWVPIAWTLALTLGWVALALGLVTVREGSVTEALSRPMTAREKVTAAVIVCAWMIAESQLSDRKTKAPLHFEGPYVARSEFSSVEVSYNRPEGRARAELLTYGLSSDLGVMRAALGWGSVPPVRVALRESLDGATFEPVELNTADGVLVRANFMAPEGYDAAALRAAVLGQVLDHHTHGRSLFESQRWLRDGFARWSACRLSPESCEALPRRAALAVAQTPARAETLIRWTRTRETLGVPMSEALAWSALDALNSPQEVNALARRVFGRIPPRDLRELFYARAHPIEREVGDSTHRPFEALVTAWSARLRNARAAPETRAALGPIEAQHVEFTVVSGIGDQRTLRYRLSHAPAGLSRVALLHLDRGPFERPITETELQREEFTRSAGDVFELTLAGRYTRGQRVFTAVELDAAPVGCLVRLGARRIELP